MAVMGKVRTFENAKFPEWNRHFHRLLAAEKLMPVSEEQARGHYEVGHCPETAVAEEKATQPLTTKSPLAQHINRAEEIIETASIQEIVAMLDNCAYEGQSAEDIQMYNYWQAHHRMLLCMVEMVGRQDEVSEYQLGRIKKTKFS